MQTILRATPVAVIAVLLWGCGSRASTVSAAGSVAVAPAQSSVTHAAEDDERNKADDDLKVRVRQQYPNWSAQQVNDYVKGYNGVGAISPETYAKTRAVLDSARSLRCQFPRGSYIDLADLSLERHEGAGSDVTFDAIDRQRGHARVIAKAGAGDVTVVTGQTALTFLEIAPTGNPLLTVVFPRFLAGTREFYAADSENTSSPSAISALASISRELYSSRMTFLFSAWRIPTWSCQPPWACRQLL